MIDLYTWPTPNGHKVQIMLEETGPDYRIRPVDLGDNEQFEAEFLAGEYSVADTACFPWMRVHQRLGIDVKDYPNVARWLETINARQAVRCALESL